MFSKLACVGISWWDKVEVELEWEEAMLELKDEQSDEVTKVYIV